MTSATQPNTMTPKRLLILLACASLLTGCHKKKQGAGPEFPPARHRRLRQHRAGSHRQHHRRPPRHRARLSTVVLNWRTTNATTVSIDGIGQVNVNGTQTVSPSNSTNFHLIAKGDGGTTEANVRVTVRVASVPTGGNTTMEDPNAARNAANAQGGPVTAAAFAAAVQDMFFDYDSFDVRPDAARPPPPRPPPSSSSTLTSASSSPAMPTSAAPPSTTSRSAKIAPTRPRRPHSSTQAWQEPASAPSQSARKNSSAPKPTKPAGRKTAAPSSPSTSSRT